MKLKDKTYKKFVEYFKRMSNKHDENEFEIAYSEIQRETGVASITLKKAIQILEDDKIIEVNQGRNTRYAKFKYLQTTNNNIASYINPVKNKNSVNAEESQLTILHQLKNLATYVDQLRQRVRTQEMTISVILDRLAELEDKR